MSWRKKGLIGVACALFAATAYSQPEVIYDSGGFEGFVLSESVGSASNKAAGTWSTHLSSSLTKGWSILPGADVVVATATGQGQVLSFANGATVKLALEWEGKGSTGQPNRDQPSVITYEFDMLTNNVEEMEMRSYRNATAETGNAVGVAFGAFMSGPQPSPQIIDARMHLNTPPANVPPITPVTSNVLDGNLSGGWHHIKVMVYHAFPPDSQTVPNFGSFHPMVIFEVDGLTLQGDDVFYSDWPIWNGHLYSLQFSADQIGASGAFSIDNLKVTWDDWHLPSRVSFVGAWDPDPAEFDWGNLLFDPNLALLRLNEGDPGLMMLRRVFYYSGVNLGTWVGEMNTGNNGEPYDAEVPYDNYDPPFPLPHEAYPGLHLRTDYVQCWKATSEIASLLMDSNKIFGFHLGDEPVLNGARVLEIADIVNEIKDPVYGFDSSTIYWLDSHRIFEHEFIFEPPFETRAGTWLNRAGTTMPNKITNPADPLGPLIFKVGGWKEKYYGPNEIERRAPAGTGLEEWTIPTEIDWITSYWYQLKPDEFHFLQEYYRDQLYTRMESGDQRVFLTPGGIIELDKPSSGMSTSPNIDHQRHNMQHMARHLLWATRGDSSGGTVGGAVQPIIGIAPWLWSNRIEWNNQICKTGCLHYKAEDPGPPLEPEEDFGWFGIEGVPEHRTQFESYGRAIDENYVPFGPPSPPAVPDLVQGFEVFSDGEVLPSIYEWDVETYPPLAPPANTVQFKKVDGNTIIRMDRSVTTPKFRYAWGTQPRLGWNTWDGHPIQTAQFDVYVPSCYADCDESTGSGVLDIFDVTCWQSAFALSDPYACDADTSTGIGVCDIYDFLEFQNLFAVGCAEEETLSFDATLFRGKERLGRVAFTRGNNYSTDMYFSWLDWDGVVIDTKPIWDMSVPFPPPPQPTAAAAKLHEGWNTIRLEVSICDITVNDPSNNVITVYLDDVAVGWYLFEQLDKRIFKDRDCVFTSLGFQLWGAGISRSENLQIMRDELWLDNIGIWAPDGQ